MKGLTLSESSDFNPWASPQDTFDLFPIPLNLISFTSPAGYSTHYTPFFSSDFNLFAVLLGTLSLVPFLVLTLPIPVSAPVL